MTPSGNPLKENIMTTKPALKFAGSRIESVFNSLLVAVMVGAVAWAAISPSLAPVLNRI
jgi:hypothetical protein